MDINSTFPSNYVKCSELKGRDVRVVIDDVKVETVGDDDKPVLYFRGTSKGLVLNKTNANTIADMYGPETDHWMGKEVTLYPTKTDYAGKRVDAIRVRYVDQQQRPASQQQLQQVQPRHDERKMPPVDDMGGDEIPF